jgi:hypothetical protein
MACRSNQSYLFIFNYCGLYNKSSFKREFCFKVLCEICYLEVQLCEGLIVNINFFQFLHSTRCLINLRLDIRYTSQCLILSFLLNFKILLYLQDQRFSRALEFFPDLLGFIFGKLCWLVLFKRRRSHIGWSLLLW